MINHAAALISRVTTKHLSAARAVEYVCVINMIKKHVRTTSKQRHASGGDDNQPDFYPNPANNVTRQPFATKSSINWSDYDIS